MTKEELKSRIVSANAAYRDGSPVMDDISYDALLDQYKTLVDSAEFEEFVATLHEKAGKVANEFLLGSLNKLKVQEPDAITAFIGKYVKTGLNVSAKVDGISCRIRYKGGKLVSANTRGDGYYGEDLTDKIFSVKSVPHAIQFDGDLDVRGELVILKEDFATMGCDKNSRNVCAGIMNRKRSSKEWNEEDLKKVSFVPYTILDAKHSKKEQFEILEKFGFDTTWHRSFEPGYFEKNGLDAVEELAKYATQDLPYAIDGVVISDDSYINEEKYRPDAQMAVKTNALEAETTLIDVQWEGPSKDGSFCPVAIIEPTELGDSCIGRATLHNLDYISELGLKCGSRVILQKAGDIIPKITECVSTPANAVDIEIISECPCCGSKLVRDGVNMRCVNPECRTQKIYQIEHFIKKLGVMNASFKTLESFGIDSYEKLVAFVPDSKRKVETKFATELKNKVFTRSEIDLFSALNIRDLGETLQKKIIDFYGWDNIKNPKFEFKGLPDGIGEITLEKFKASYARNLAIVGLFTCDVRYSYDASSVKSEKKQTGKGSVCFTGALSMPRGEASKLAEAAGYEVKSSVTKGLTYLVTPDPNSGSSKNEKAKKYGTKVIDEAEFMKLVDVNAGSVMDL